MKSEFGLGNNDVLRSGVIASGTTPVVSAWMSCKESGLVSAILATTDANGVYGGGGGGGITGTWKVEIGNNIPTDDSRADGQADDALNPNGTPVDISGNFVREAIGAQIGYPLQKNVADPTLGIPAAAGASAYPIKIKGMAFRHIRFTFTPTGAQGALQRAAVFFVLKG